MAGDDIRNAVDLICFVISFTIYEYIRFQNIYGSKIRVRNTSSSLKQFIMGEKCVCIFQLVPSIKEKYIGLW